MENETKDGWTLLREPEAGDWVGAVLLAKGVKFPVWVKPDGDEHIFLREYQETDA